MADNFLEKKLIEYQKKKEAWLHKKHASFKHRRPEKPEDESL